ncbi:MAG: hypothetical protein F6K14_09480 [Symploca sp. SIO2C1]|nr:hypothetical protein [Symploca sp. SIO2C1]
MAKGDKASIHRYQQRENWNRFLQKLKALKDEIGCSNDDLALGLGISRQKYYQFLKDPGSGLPIDRANVLELWEHLAEEKGEKSPLTETHTLDELLEAAGFRSTLNTNPSFERIRSRLEGPWIQDSTVLCRLVDDIIDLILDRGTNPSPDSKDDRKTEYTITEAKKWPEENLKDGTNLRAKKQYIRQIDKFVCSGKVKFCADELYELYQGILENQRFRIFNIDLEAIDCRFDTISFALPKEAEVDGKIVDVDVAQLCRQAEQELHAHQSSDALPSQTSIPTFPAVVNASVTLNLIDGEKDDTNPEATKQVTFSYASACTHLESILVALSNGLGYFLSESLLADGSRTLKLGGLFMRALGDRTDSLTRISTTLIDEEDKIHQGLWVEQNMILGFLQATTAAALSWFSEQFDDGKTLSEFLDICCRSTEVYQNLYTYLDSVYNYGAQETRADNTTNPVAETREVTSFAIKKTQEFIKTTKELVNKLEEIKQDLLKQGKPKKIRKYLNNYRSCLATKNLLAQTALTHAYLNQGSFKEADNKLVDLQNQLYRGELAMSNDRHLVPTTILYESSRILFNLLTDKNHCLREEEWYLVASIPILQHPIEELSKYAEQNNTGIVDFDVYLAASLFLDVVGLAEFYVFSSEQIATAIEKFIKASHYSAQIGYRQRAARCLCYVSRIYSRLGQHEAAEEFIASARKLLIKPRVRFTSHNSNHHILIAEGEMRWSKLLEDRDSANIPLILCYFVTAWDKSKRYGSPRSEKDSLYNIYRVIEKFSETENSNAQIKGLVEESIHVANSEPDKQKLFLPELSHSRSYRDICKELFSDYPKCTYKQASDDLKERVKEFWDRGVQVYEPEPRPHLFSRMIDEGTFLSVIPRERRQEAGGRRQKGS